MSVGPSGSQYGVAGAGPSLVDSMVLDKLVEDSGVFCRSHLAQTSDRRFLPLDGSDDEAPRHYQLLPLPKKDSSLPFTPPEHTPGVNRDDRLENGDMEVDKGECKFDVLIALQTCKCLTFGLAEGLPSRGTPTRGVAQPGEERREDVNVEIDPAIMGPPAEDPELVSQVKSPSFSKFTEHD